MTRLANLRDVGGLPLVGGGTTRRGVLYRSDAPYAGDETPTELAWPPRLVIDLRGASESSVARADWPATTRVVSHPLHDAGQLAQMSHVATLMNIYETILRDATARIVEVLDLMVDAGGPVLIHCAAGKDRTGVVVAALLLLAGAESGAVVRDYQATASAMPRVLERLRDGTGLDITSLDDEWTAAPEPGVRLVIDVLTGPPGGPVQWFLDHGASPHSIDSWRDALRELPAACPSPGRRTRLH